MDIENYFASAIEVGKLVQKYLNASEDKKSELELEINQSSYMSKVRNIQSIWEGGFSEGVTDKSKINKSRKDFFINTAVPSPIENNRHSKNNMAYHKHDYVELIFVLRGEYTQSINGKLHQHKAGDICMLNSNVIHRDENIGPKDRVLFIGFSIEYLFKELLAAFINHKKLEDFIINNKNNMNQQYVLFNPLNFEKIEELLEKIIEEDEAKLPGHHLIIKGLLVRTFKMLVGKERYKIYYEKIEEIHENLVMEMIDYIRNNLKTVNRKELASFFHYHPDYINRLMCKITGSTYSEMLKKIRLEISADQLRETTKSVNEIIHDVGISNNGYFNRIFKEKYGKLPGDYRENIKG